VFNVNETGITVVQPKLKRVIAVKGREEIATVSSAERGAV
jgi:hypothetical protein